MKVHLHRRIEEPNMPDQSDTEARASGLFIFYDGTCAMCTRGVARYGPMMRLAAFLHTMGLFSAYAPVFR